jgi:hypothetical protein
MTDKSKWPQWLREAYTKNAAVEMRDGVVNWLGGTFLGGTFWGGEFRGGEFRGGEFRGGEFLGGAFLGGEFLGGTFQPPAKWYKEEDRVLYMAAMCGIVFGSDGYAYGYRSTNANNTGRYNIAFDQMCGRIRISNAKPAGSGTCCAGLHVASAATAYTYFGVDPTAKLWRVRFRRANLLDCDGEKARINGGFCEEIPWPFLPKAKAKKSEPEKEARP